jgi:hypothetical protein
MQGVIRRIHWSRGECRWGSEANYEPYVDQGRPASATT